MNRVMIPSYKQNMFIGWEYGFTPKFIRMQVMHELLFYLVYDFNSDNVQTAIGKLGYQKSDTVSVYYKYCFTFRRNTT